jgi:hypothetical protein
MEAHHLRLNLGSNSFSPYYDGLSLVNLPSSICHWLGIPGIGEPPVDREILDLYEPGFRHVILVVVDGMGLNTVQAALQRAQTDPDYAVWSNLLESGALAPLTSIVPSTTAAALTTLWTGTAPAEHGTVGYEVWLKEYGMIANMILHSPASYHGDPGSLRRAGFDPLNFLPVSMLGPHLCRQGVKPYAFQHQSIAHSGLSDMLFQGVQVAPFRSLSDLWVSLGDMLDAAPEEQNYTYVYWSDLDEHSHRFGPDDPRVALELASFSRQLNYFVRQRQAQARKDTLLLITADHGHIHTPKLPEYELRSHPDLMKLLVMSPSGEARLPFVFLRPGCEQEFLNYVEATWPGQFLPIPAQQAIQAGLFGSGEITGCLIDRVGDYVVIPQGNAYWWFESRDNPLLGRHGGVHPTEMQIPLLSAVL